MQALKAKHKFGSASKSAAKGIGIQAGSMLRIRLPPRRIHFEPFPFVTSLSLLKTHLSANSKMSEQNLKDFNSDAEGTDWLAHPTSCD